MALVRTTFSLVTGLVLAASMTACGGGTPAAKPESAAPPPASSPAASTTTAGAANEPNNVADLFPPGPGRDAVLNNCSACHNLACSLIGQRTPERWSELQKSHSDKVPDTDLGVLFGYLSSHFSNAQPEPKVPAKFLQGGCTPF